MILASAVDGVRVDQTYFGLFVIIAFADVLIVIFAVDGMRVDTVLYASDGILLK